MAEHRFGDSSRQAINKIRGQGISIPDSPDFDMPSLPADITVLSGEDVIVLLSDITSWLEFIEVQFYSAQVDEEFERIKLDELQASIQIEQKTEKTVSSQKAHAVVDEKVVEQRMRHHRAYTYRKLMETVYNRLDRQRFIVSREITRRTGS